MKSSMLHERRDWRGLTPYAPDDTDPPVPGIVSGASCPLGYKYYYGPTFYPYNFQNTSGFTFAPTYFVRPLSYVGNGGMSSGQYQVRGSKMYGAFRLNRGGVPGSGYPAGGLSFRMTAFSASNVVLNSSGFNITDVTSNPAAGQGYVASDNTFYRLFMTYTISLTGLPTIAYSLYSDLGALLKVASYSGPDGTFPSDATNRLFFFNGTDPTYVECTSLWIYAPASTDFTQNCAGIF